MKAYNFLTLLALPLLVLSSPLPVQLSDIGYESFPTRSLEERAVTTEDGLTTDACKALILIFARGTNEEGNVGEIAGPPWFTALRASLGTEKVTVQGVAYAANVAGSVVPFVVFRLKWLMLTNLRRYLIGGDPAGSKTMATLINQASTKCPSAKIVLGGYRYVFTHHYLINLLILLLHSQGAQLVHNAAKTLTAAVTAKIAAGMSFFIFQSPLVPSISLHPPF
jgi:cutinase